MLSAQSTAVVQATAGVVSAHIDEITRRFYPHMFEAHPELMNTFNMANQAIGDQPRALAASVVAYATQLIDPDAPDFRPIAERIAHKHVSLGITASQYTIVGHHLMWAIGDVLGEAVTPEIAAAWDEVYWLFALQLVAAEAKLYAEGGTDPAHPWRDYRVTHRIDESDIAFSLVMAPVEGALPAHRTGQYVALNVEIEPGHTQPRQYTISGAPEGEAFRITVKREDGRDGHPHGQVSHWLYENATPGAVLQVSQPAGDVVLDESEAPLVLVSSGIGVTPMAAILEDIVQRQPQRPVRIYHADRSPGLHALFDSMQEMSTRLSDFSAVVWYREGVDQARTSRPAREGRMDLADVDIPAGSTAFMCGSLPFMRGARRQLMERGVPAERIAYEVFGPDLWAQNPDAAGADSAEGERASDSGD